MGIDCKIYLPENVRVADVASVIGVAAGLPTRGVGLAGGGWAALVDGVEIESTSIPSMARIRLDGRAVDDVDNHFVLFFFEHERPGRLLNPPSTAFWVAVGDRLINFFGGKIDYNDCDNVDRNDYVPERTWEENRPEGGEAWYRLQRRILDVKPITPEDLEYWAQVAAW